MAEIIGPVRGTPSFRRGVVLCLIQRKLAEDRTWVSLKLYSHYEDDIMWRYSKHGIQGMALRGKFQPHLWENEAVVWLAKTLF